MAANEVTAAIVGRAVQTRLEGGWTDVNSRLLGEKSQDEGKDRQYAWQCQDGWRESSSGGQWKSRQYEKVPDGNSRLQ